MLVHIKKFCPLRSTAEKEVDCSERCMWYLPSEDTDETCSMIHCLTSLGVLINVIENKEK